MDNEAEEFNTMPKTAVLLQSMPQVPGFALRNDQIIVKSVTFSDAATSRISLEAQS